MSLPVLDALLYKRVSAIEATRVTGGILGDTNTTSTAKSLVDGRDDNSKGA